MNDPDAEISRCVTALLSTATPTRTGAIETCVIQLVVIPFHSSPAREPTRASALGIFQVTRLTSSSSMPGMVRAPVSGRRRPRRSAIGTATGGPGRSRRRIRVTPAAATRHPTPARTNAGRYDPVTSRSAPAPHAASAAPSWWPAKTQPKTSGPRCGPKPLMHSATVGGTVATQSRP